MAQLIFDVAWNHHCVGDFLAQQLIDHIATRSRVLLLTEFLKSRVAMQRIEHGIEREHAIVREIFLASTRQSGIESSFSTAALARSVFPTDGKTTVGWVLESRLIARLQMPFAAKQEVKQATQTGASLFPPTRRWLWNLS